MPTGVYDRSKAKARGAWVGHSRKRISDEIRAQIQAQPATTTFSTIAKQFNISDVAAGEIWKEGNPGVPHAQRHLVKLHPAPLPVAVPKKRGRPKGSKTKRTKLLTPANRKRWAAKRHGVLVGDIRAVADVTALAAEPKHTFASGAQRSERGAPYSLIWPDSLRRIAKRFEMGRDKYGEFNYMKGAYDRDFLMGMFDHAYEHLAQFRMKGNVDDDNLAAIGWFVAAMMMFETYNPDLLELINGPREAAFAEARKNHHKSPAKKKVLGKKK